MSKAPKLEWDLSMDRSVERVGWDQYPKRSIVGDMLIIERSLDEPPIHLVLWLPEGISVKGLFGYISVTREGEKVQRILLTTPGVTAAGACERLEELVESLLLDEQARSNVAAWCRDAATKPRDAPVLDSGVGRFVEDPAGPPALFLAARRSYDLTRQADWVVHVHITWPRMDLWEE